LKPPTFVGFMVSARCNAKCVYCPIGSQGTGISPPFMEPSIAVAAAHDLRENRFDGYLNIGENGEPLLNPKWPEIVRVLRKSLPEARLVIHSNMYLMEAPAARLLLKNGLFALILNFDGATPRSYGAVRRLSYAKVERNVRNFIRIRNHAGHPCRIVIAVSTLANFMANAYGISGPCADDSAQVIEKWRGHLRHDDAIQVNTGFWRWMNPYSQDCSSELLCPMAGRFDTDCFVATDGALYLCCLDYRTHIRFERVQEKSLTSVFNGESRRLLVDSIRKRVWQKVGFPCDSCPSRQEVLEVQMERGWAETPPWEGTRHPLGLHQTDDSPSTSLRALLPEHTAYLSM